jgi:hypothetical protein
VSEGGDLGIAEQIGDLLDADAVVQIAQRQLVAHLVEQPLVGEAPFGQVAGERARAHTELARHIVELGLAGGEQGRDRFPRFVGEVLGSRPPAEDLAAVAAQDLQQFVVRGLHRVIQDRPLQDESHPFPPIMDGRREALPDDLRVLGPGMTEFDADRRHLARGHQFAELHQKSHSELGRLPLVSNQGVDDAAHDDGFLVRNREGDIDAFGQDTIVALQIRERVTKRG